MEMLTVTAVLSLLAMSAAKPQNCENLTQPLTLNQTQISGKWIFIAATSAHPKFAYILSILNSSSTDVVWSPDKEAFSATQNHMMNGICLYSHYNMTFSGNTFNFTNEDAMTFCTVLPACPDCLVGRCTSRDSETVMETLSIYGRTKQLSQPDLEMFQDQIDCLGFPPPIFKYDPEQDICPDEEKHAGAKKEIVEQ